MELFWRKIFMATTGLFLCVFLIVHLLGNSLLLLPESVAPSTYNHYSEMLSGNLIIKIVAVFLYLSILAHVLVSCVITLKNKKAKKVAYAVNQTQENSSWTSRNMGILGGLILLFLTVHLYDFWFKVKLGFGAVPVSPSGGIDLYHMVTEHFKNPLYVLFYSGLMIPLGLHVLHGLKSATHSLGFYHRQGLKWMTYLSQVYTLVMVLGFGLIPIVILIRQMH